MNDEIQAIERQILALNEKLGDARRRAQPEPVRDYTLRNPDGSEVRLSELFGDHDDLILIHNMGRSCVYCTLWADGFDSSAPHLENRAAFVLASADEPDTLREFADSRAWRYRVVSAAGSDLAKDMGFASPTGDPWPGVSAFRRKPDGSIVRTGRSPFGPGDPFCSTWHLFDLLENGADGWTPKYAYT